MRRLLYFAAGLDAVLTAFCLTTGDTLGVVVGVLSAALCIYGAEVRP